MLKRSGRERKAVRKPLVPRPGKFRESYRRRREARLATPTRKPEETPGQVAARHVAGTVISCTRFPLPVGVSSSRLSPRPRP
jgi:hypothetical protein